MVSREDRKEAKEREGEWFVFFDFLRFLRET
jgi:hypothetical protein